MAVNLTTCKFIPTVFFYDLSFLCSFIVSHPLYFSYFIFFSPYLFRFIFFISPLFLTTSLLLLLSVIATTFPQSKLGFIQTVVDKLRSKINDADEDDEFRDFEDFEIYKIVFHDQPLLTVGDGDGKQAPVTENSVAVTESEEQRSLEKLFEELDRFDAYTSSFEMNENETTSHYDEAVGQLRKLTISGEDKKIDEIANPWRLDSSSSFESCGSVGDETTSFETKENETKLESVKTSFSGEDQKTVKSNSTPVIEKKDNKAGSHVRGILQKLEPPPAKSISGEDKKSVQNSFPGEDQKTAKLNSTPAIEKKDIKTGSHVRAVLQKLESPAISISGEDLKSGQNSFSMRSNSWIFDSSSSFGSYGSMRKEKEWKRTLACKLFEERNNSQGGEEGMDSLWEAYEDDNNSSRKPKKKKMVMKNKKKSEFKYFDEIENDDDDVDDDDDDVDDEFMSNGQVCCLKALKLSTGKMNLGMGKPNLVKITKAIKGFGWLHHVGSKHGKKH